ncbi:MAG: hypothetical protein Ct9H300mP10_02000 [Methanobacteriota archaeon]|nr:MAG: hypothetical protein Ct9H300mP10_02000 [Euryarchaeota archaeon]
MERVGSDPLHITDQEQAHLVPEQCEAGSCDRPRHVPLGPAESRRDVRVPVGDQSPGFSAAETSGD